MIPIAYDVVRQTLLVLLPEFLILAVAMAMMTAGAFVRFPRRLWSRVSGLTLLVALVILFLVRDQQPSPYSAVALNDALSWYARLVFLLTSLVLLGMAHDQVDDARAAEFFGALLMIFAGSMLVAAANEIVFLFVGLELVSIPTYLILYLPRRSTSTQEAATKYFYLSIFSSALGLFGLAYLYGILGVSNLKALGYLCHFAPHIPVEFALIAVVFVVAGLGFRVAAVPFHFYAPDVYQGSPAVIAALLAWFPKGVGFVAILRVLTSVLAATDVAGKAITLVWIIAVVTMTLGNAVALQQNNLKRLLAYSSIAHAGYLMIGVAVAFQNDPTISATFLGSQGILFYLVAYALMTLGVFAGIVALDSPERPIETVEDLADLGWTRPWAGLALALCLFSLAGVPPMAGFWGKFYIFASAFAVGSGDDPRMFRWLAVIGVLNAAVGAYYYLRIVVVMYLRPAELPAPRKRIAWPAGAAVAICAALSLLVGILPTPVASASREAALAASSFPSPLPARTAAVTATPLPAPAPPPGR